MGGSQAPTQRQRVARGLSNRPSLPCPKCGVVRLVWPKTSTTKLCDACIEAKEDAKRAAARQQAMCLVTIARIERWFGWDRTAAMLEELEQVTAS